MSALDRLTAALADRYRIERELGQGGMATVYLAEDVRHRRKVAVKVLHPELSAVLGTDRFLKEIELTAGLQHPHILPLFDSGAVEGLLYYVMPFVEGESLRSRLTREHQLPIPDAVRIATDVADALEYAHKRGVIHRDIKPENILLHEGRPQVADFGIALAVQQAGGSRMTQTGLSLGTPQYMAPEQAMGDRSVDARADVYAMGVVTYEMLTGEPPFTGPTPQSIVAKVMTEAPRAITAQRRTVPAEVEGAVLTALEKLPADRFASAAEYASALAGDAKRSGPKDPRRTSSTSRKTATRWLPVVAVAVGGILLGFGIGWKLRPRQSAAVVRFSPIFPAGQVPTSSADDPNLAISADGSQIAYLGTGFQLYLRPLDQLVARIVSGSEGASTPFFSPDGQWLGFVLGGQLYKLPVSGGVPQAITASVYNRGSSWGMDDRIYFGTTRDLSGLSAVSSNGGPVETLTTLDRARHELSHIWPEVLPNGKGVIFTIAVGTPTGDSTFIAVLSLGNGKVTRLLPGYHARYLSTGHLVYTIQGTLLAVPFDAEKLVVTGVPVALVAGLSTKRREFALSASGTLAYLTGEAAEGGNELVFRSMDGRERVLSESRIKNGLGPRFSPDGRSIAFSQVNQSPGVSRAIWTYSLGSGAFKRLTFAGDALYPTWTRDGRRLIYGASESETPLAGQYRLLARPADGSGQASVFFASDSSVIEGSLGGGNLLYRVRGGDNLYVAQAPTLGISTPFAVETGTQAAPAISADGHWAAYSSDQTGRNEIYVRPFPGATGQWQVSSNGGTEPVWAPDGRHLYYRQADSLIDVQVQTTPGFARGTRRVLFSGRYVSTPLHAAYDVSPDGKTFVLLKVTEQNSEMQVVLNWGEEVRRQVRPR